MIVPVGIALGSNLGDRSAELDAGISFLRSLSIDKKVLEAPRMETAPVDCPPGSAAFLNAVAEIEIDPAILPPRALLKQLQDFELSRGRSRVREVNAPRPLDLDIIYYGNELIDQNRASSFPIRARLSAASSSNRSRICAPIWSCTGQTKNRAGTVPRIAKVHFNVPSF